VCSIVKYFVSVMHLFCENTSRIYAIGFVHNILTLTSSFKQEIMHFTYFSLSLRNIVGSNKCQISNEDQWYYFSTMPENMIM